MEKEELKKYYGLVIDDCLQILIGKKMEEYLPCAMYNSTKAPYAYIVGIEEKSSGELVYFQKIKNGEIAKELPRLIAAEYIDLISKGNVIGGRQELGSESKEYSINYYNGLVDWSIDNEVAFVQNIIDNNICLVKTRPNNEGECFILTAKVGDKILASKKIKIV